MHLEIERAPSTMDDGHRTRLSIRDALEAELCLGSMLHGAHHLAHNDGDDPCQELVVVGQDKSQGRGEGTHPLAHRDSGENVVHQASRTRYHSASGTARAEASASAGQSDEPLKVAGGATLASESESQAAATEKSLEVTFIVHHLAMLLGLLDSAV